MVITAIQVHQALLTGKHRMRLLPIQLLARNPPTQLTLQKNSLTFIAQILATFNAHITVVEGGVAKSFATIDKLVTALIKPKCGILFVI